MYDDRDAVHHLDVSRWEIVYRVFLLGSTLQVDISFWSPGDERLSPAARPGRGTPRVFERSDIKQLLLFAD